MASLIRQRDTPTRSPFAKSAQPRPSLKPRPDLSLQLDRVIGTTCGASTRFDINHATNSFAYVAGAAAVLVTIQQDGKTLQRFFRANASQTSTGRPASSNGGASTPSTTQDFRNRFTQRTREGSPFAASSNSEVSDSPGSSGHAKDRVKAATAVAISPSGRLLAYGETGYRPRVLLFPITDKRSADNPSAVISEHSFGIQAVAFDGEGKLLATLGVINDGFLYVWDVDQRTSAVTLLASNKCTTSVKQIAWMGRNLVTVGVRFVKVWRVDEVSPSSGVEYEQFQSFSKPGHRPLVGRNALLGDMLEATFTAVVPLSPTSAVLCSDAGDVCLLDDADKQQRLTQLCVEAFSITAACLLDSDHLLITGSNGETKVLQISTLQRSDTPLSRGPTPTLRKANQKSATYPVAVGALSGVTVTVDSKHSIRFSPAPLEPDSEIQDLPQAMVSHSDAIKGIRAAATSAPNAFVTWSSDGAVNGWTEDCQLSFQLRIPLETADDPSDMINELKTVALFPQSPLVICGDKYGMLRVVDIATKASVLDIRAHASEITDIAVREIDGTICVATASRDRTVQLFTWKGTELELVQTLDDHAGAVTHVSFTEDAQHLLSCSTDRTVVVRERIQGAGQDDFLFAAVRTVNLKSAPTSMVLGPTANHLLVSAADRTINTIDIKTGKVVTTFKAADSDGADPVALSNIAHLDFAGSPIVAGVSSMDKSVRIYSEDGTLLARDWGHTEGVTGISVLPGTSDTLKQPRLVTTAADGTVFLWTLRSRSSAAQTDDALTPTTTASPLARPLRKVISMSELTRLRRSSISPAADSEPSTPAARSPGPRPPRLSIAHAPKFSPGHSPRTPRSPSPARPSSLSPTRSPSKLGYFETKHDGSPRAAAKGVGKEDTVAGLVERLRAFRAVLAGDQKMRLDGDAGRELVEELAALAQEVGVRRSMLEAVDE